MLNSEAGLGYCEGTH